MYGRYGITFSAILFAVLHVGYGSVSDVIFVFGVAIVFGLVTHFSGSLLGVSIANVDQYRVVVGVPAFGGEYFFQPVDRKVPHLVLTKKSPGDPEL